MATETEIKIINPPADIEERIKMVGASPQSETMMQVTYFDFIDDRLKKSRKELRLRRVSNMTKNYEEITLKEKMENRKSNMVRDELREIVHCDGLRHSDLSNILTSIGMVAVLYYKKKRYHYTMGKVDITIDKFDDEKMMDILEVEGPDVETVKRIAELFKGPGSKLSTKSVKQLFEELKEDG